MCDHISKVLKWGVASNGDFRVALWGCTNCDETFTEAPSHSEVAERVEHESSCDCFGCKARTLKVAYSGIGGGDYTAQKKWDKNLDLYRQARAEGIQPKGTSERAVKAAIKQSDKTGTAFKAG